VLFPDGWLCESSLHELKRRLRALWHSVGQTTGLSLSSHKPVRDIGNCSFRPIPLSIRRAPAHPGLSVAASDFVITIGQSRSCHTFIWIHRITNNALRWQSNADFWISDYKCIEFPLGDAKNGDASDGNQATPQALVFSRRCHRNGMALEPLQTSHRLWGKKAQLIFGINGFTTKLLNNQIYDELIVARNG
jgi:hypothetical protein